MRKIILRNKVIQNHVVGDQVTVRPVKIHYINKYFDISSQRFETIVSHRDTI